ncbi:MAG: G patch domain-containing protein [Firmicutes bacterium]|nr:G patch domain-containing protein [Bacillota bacterium]
MAFPLVFPKTGNTIRWALGSESQGQKNPVEAVKKSRVRGLVTYLHTMAVFLVDRHQNI